MTRRRWLVLVASGLGALALGGVRLVPRAWERLRRAPADIVARIRRHTRPLDRGSLDEPNDLAG